MRSADLINQHCSVARPATLLGDPWTLVILRQAFSRVRRFDEFQRQLGISRSLLSERLGRLVEAGILERRPYKDEIRTREEYRLTQKGLDLYPALMALREWGDRYMADEGPPHPPPPPRLRRRAPRPPDLRSLRRGGLGAGRRGRSRAGPARGLRLACLGQPRLNPVEEAAPALLGPLELLRQSCRPRCSISISVRPSPRSVSTTVIRPRSGSSGDRSPSAPGARARSPRCTRPFQSISCRSGPANMVAFQEPPSRTSISTVSSGTSPSGPPNQSAKASGVVHSRQTRSRGASNTRVIEMPGSDVGVGDALVSSRWGLLSIVETRFRAGRSHSPRSDGIRSSHSLGVAKRRRLQPRGPQLRGAAARDQAGALEHLEVLRDRLHADRERLGELAHGRLSLGQAGRGWPAGSGRRARRRCRRAGGCPGRRPSDADCIQLLG